MTNTASPYPASPSRSFASASSWCLSFGQAVYGSQQHASFRSLSQRLTTAHIPTPSSSMRGRSRTHIEEPIRSTGITLDSDGNLVQQVPLVYFLALEPGGMRSRFQPSLDRDSPADLLFSLLVDDVGLRLDLDDDLPEAEPEPRRAYVTASVQRRLHQVVFRERVIRAYKERCALCRLAHRELLDAAHITPDRVERGTPAVSNGLSL